MIKDDGMDCVLDAEAEVVAVPTMPVYARLQLQTADSETRVKLHDSTAVAWAVVPLVTIIASRETLYVASPWIRVAGFFNAHLDAPDKQAIS